MGKEITREFIPFKRWSLKEGQDESELVALIQNEIMPHYAKLEGVHKLELLRIDGTRSYMATQYWKSRAARETVISSALYQEWFQAYEPILERWDDLMTFEAEWETERVL